MDNFDESSYLSQAKKLHVLAKAALTHYPIKIKKIELKRYAANATYKITDSRNKNYQLRIHPEKWHTKAAILEEISWLNHIIKTTDIIVPKPISTKDGQFIIQCQRSPANRYCEMFEWLPGRKRWSSINKKYAFDLGLLIGKLHKSGQSFDVKNRYYWDVESLLGTKKARLFNIEKLSYTNKNQQTLITEARKLVYDWLKQYEKTFKNKTGLIHYDVQPNNILYHHNKISIIDFDDCGVGLYAYELAGILNAFHHLTNGNKNKNYHELESALFEGYSNVMPLEKEDFQIMPYCILGVRLVTLGWLERHKDNLGLKKYCNDAIIGVMHYYKMLQRTEFQ